MSIDDGALKGAAISHVSDIEVGRARKATTGDIVFAVYDVDGEIFVTDDACTHDPGSLSESILEDGIIECNFHCSQFYVRAGKVILRPCMESVKTYKLPFESRVIFIDVWIRTDSK